MSYSRDDGRRAVNVKRPRPWKSLQLHHQHADEEDAFEFDPRPLLDLRVWKTARRSPLGMEPSVIEESAAAAECSPLLQSFLDSLPSQHYFPNKSNKPPATRNTSTSSSFLSPENDAPLSESLEEEENDGGDSSAVECQGTVVEEALFISPLARLENGSAATLTRGQHARFLALHNQQQQHGATKQGSTGSISKQDVKSVVQAVQAERYTYAQALATVWTQNTHIFLHGFRGRLLFD
jgi:hypothetical protein